METIRFFEISIEYDKWRTVDEQRDLESTLGKALKWAPRPSDSTEGAAESTVKYTKATQGKWDQGLRQLSWDSRQQIVSEESLTKFLPCQVERVINTKVGVQVELIEHRVTAAMNDRAQVIVPGPALNSYDSVCVLEDCCTDTLQEELDKGWRILAICVQPDQRRPDYVMGRNQPEDL